MHTIQLELPEAIENALVAHCKRTGDSIDHVIVRSLADFLDLEHHSIYQVSTSGALVEGVYQGCVRVREILKQGDFGLGTFHGLDGEGILLDGSCFHARSDGTVHPADPDHLTPFWVATHFKSDVEATFDQIEDWKDLLSRLDTLRPSDNIFAAIRIDGIFSRVHYRVACKAKSGIDLVTATQHQAEYCFEQIDGTLVGFLPRNMRIRLTFPGTICISSVEIVPMVGMFWIWLLLQ